MSRDIFTCCKLDIKREAFISDHYYEQKSNKPFYNNVSNKFYRNPIEKQRKEIRMRSTILGKNLCIMLITNYYLLKLQIN